MNVTRADKKVSRRATNLTRADENVTRRAVNVTRADKTSLVVTLTAQDVNVMERLLRFPGSRRHDPGIDAWMRAKPDDLGTIARHWFEAMRNCGEDVRELLHDGYPTACIGDAAFGYVNAFTAHVNVGFFRGAELPDPNGLLEGTGRFMRHVKIKPGDEIDAAALTDLIRVSYADMKWRLASL